MTFDEIKLTLIRTGLPIRQQDLIDSGYFSKSTLTRLKKVGLPHHKVGGMVFYDLDELREFLTQGSPEDATSEN